MTGVHLHCARKKGLFNDPNGNAVYGRRDGKGLGVGRRLCWNSNGVFPIARGDRSTIVIVLWAKSPVSHTYFPSWRCSPSCIYIPHNILCFFFFFCQIWISFEKRWSRSQSYKTYTIHEYIYVYWKKWPRGLYMNLFNIAVRRQTLNVPLKRVTYSGFFFFFMFTFQRVFVYFFKLSNRINRNTFL